MANIFISGRNTYLRVLNRDDLPDLGVWMNDRAVTHYLYRGFFPVHLEIMEQNYAAMVNNPHEEEVAICAYPENNLIGVGGLHGINHLAHSAELRILLGDKNFWGRGYGTEATQLILAWAFEILNLHKVWLGVNAAQSNAIRLYEKVGFIREGILRDEVWRNGRYYDAIRMSILECEYRRQWKNWLCATELATQFSQ